MTSRPIVTRKSSSQSPFLGSLSRNTPPTSYHSPFPPPSTTASSGPGTPDWSDSYSLYEATSPGQLSAASVRGGGGGGSGGGSGGAAVSGMPMQMQMQGLVNGPDSLMAMVVSQAVNNTGRQRRRAKLRTSSI